MDRSGLRCASVCGSLCSGRRRDCGLTPDPAGRAAGQEGSVTVVPREPYFETVEYVSAGGDHRDPTD